jgi:hypothetical protein
MGHATMETTAISCNAVGEEQQNIAASMGTSAWTLLAERNARGQQLGTEDGCAASCPALYGGAPGRRARERKSESVF